MSIDFLERRRAEDFHQALEGTPGAEVDAQLTALVALARGLSAVEAPAPRAEVTADLRARLMAEAPAALAPVDDRLVLPARSGRTSRRRQRLAGAVAAAALVAVPAGVAAASQTALPGDVLYSVKRGLEAAGERVSLSDASRGSDALGQATSRLDELAALGADADPLQVERSLQDFADSASRGGALLLADYAQDGDRESVSAVRDFAAEAMPRLESLATGSDPILLSRYAAAGDLVAQLDGQARDACSACGGREPLQLPALLADDVAFASARTTLTELLLDDPAQALAPRQPAETGGTAGAPSAGSGGGVTEGPQSPPAEGSQVVVDGDLAGTVRDLLSGRLLAPRSGDGGGSSAGGVATGTNQFDPANVLGTVTTTAGSTTRTVGELLSGTGGAVGDTVGGVGGLLGDTVEGTVGGLLP